MNPLKKKISDFPLISSTLLAISRSVRLTRLSISVSAKNAPSKISIQKLNILHLTNTD